MKTPRVIGALVFVGALAALMIGSRTQGNTRDEGYYFDAAELYYGWYGELGDNLLALKPQRSFTRDAITRWFGYNHEHPALMKTLFGVSWRLFHKCNCPAQRGLHPVPYAKLHRTIPILSEEAALRLPAHVLGALMALMIFSFAARAWSLRAGVVAAVLAVAAPRLFFDAQLACFDAPIAALWVAVVYAYWRSLDEPRWAWRAGLFFGFALATKHNAFFLPFVLAVHYVWLHRDKLRRAKLPPLPRAFLWMATLGPAVYFVCWPWLWFDTIAHFREYVAFHVHHVYYNMEYFGRNYNQPPFPITFPYAMTLLTVPVTTLALALGGAARLVVAWRRREPPPGAAGALVGLNALFPMAILTVTGAPIFGATKHFHATIPFLALLAGYGFHALTAALTVEPERLKRAAIALGLLVCAPAVAETWRSHPYGLSHYNALAGGPAGGADLGMNRQFWGYATRGLLPWIDANARPGERVYWHDTNHAQLNMYVRESLLRPDIGDTGLEEAGVRASNLALVIHEMHFNKYEYWIWDFYGTTRPRLVLDDEGVPLVTLYQRPTGPAPAPAPAPSKTDKK
jgi:Dolichyl-phosphate-mannose-protein mannosyltransferase